MDDAFAVQPTQCSRHTMHILKALPLGVREEHERKHEKIRWSKQ